MLDGDRRLFEAVPLAERGGEAGILGCDRRLRRAEGVVGDLDARAEPVLSGESSGWRDRRAADRVTGALYPSGVSDNSDIEGVGDITRGVAGTGFGEDISGTLNLKAGSDAALTTPKGDRVQISVLSQANMPRSINGLVNRAMMAVREHVTVLYR